jgi:hypothetical protein
VLHHLGPELREGMSLGQALSAAPHDRAVPAARWLAVAERLSSDEPEAAP